MELEDVERDAVGSRRTSEVRAVFGRGRSTGFVSSLVRSARRKRSRVPSSDGTVRGLDVLHDDRLPKCVTDE